MRFVDITPEQPPPPVQCHLDCDAVIEISSARAALPKPTYYRIAVPAMELPIGHGSDDRGALQNLEQKLKWHLQTCRAIQGELAFWLKSH